MPSKRWPLLLLMVSCGEVPNTALPRCHPVDGFDFPVGKPDAKGYYDAQPFTENHHLGSDWNGVKGGNSDLGDPVYSAADGVVSFAEEVGGGWGKVVRVISCVEELGQPQEVEALYAHFDTIAVKAGQKLKRGEQIGTIGNANGQYLAHLHFELRKKPGLPLGGGYSHDSTGYLHPTNFLKTHRPNDSNLNNSQTTPDRVHPRTTRTQRLR
jgi:murein DD-endopeptidase MepM/ murein hydrolase activator NlpD